MSVIVVVGLIAVVAGAAFVQTVSGFGFALTSVPLLALLIDAKDAVALASLFGLVSSLVLLGRTHDGVVWPVAARLTTGAVVGMPLGLFVLIVVDEQVLRLIIAGAVLAFVAVLATGATIRGKGRPVDIAAGFVSGVLNTSVSTNGPPLVLALQARQLSPAAFRATISAVFVASSLVGNVMFAVAGRYTGDVWRAAAIGVPALVVGWVAGGRVAPKVPPERFRSLVLGLLVLAAASAVASVVVN